MRLLRRNKPNDVIFLMPVRVAGEKLPKGKIRMLYCDAKGKVYASLIDRAAYRLAKDDVQKMEINNRCYATIGLEIGPGNFVPTVVEISAEEAWALSHALDHALKDGVMPHVLRKYLKSIIKLGETGHKVVSVKNKKQDGRVSREATPRVLDRLPYYLEGDIEFSMPIYKAEHRYPLIVIKRLPSSDQATNDRQRLLILDSDGDLATIKVPFQLLDQAEKRLEEWAKKNDRNACLVIYRESDGYSVNYIVISQMQRKALDIMARHFEETCYGKQPISIAAKTVLTRARDMLSQRSD